MFHTKQGVFVAGQTITYLQNRWEKIHVELRFKSTPLKKNNKPRLWKHSFMNWLP